MSQSSKTINQSLVRPEYFILVGIPGLEDVQVWISIPLCIMYLITVLGNIVMLYVILSEESLHKPMYLFLSMLSVVDLLLSSTTSPKILWVFWFSSKNIEFDACLTQMFFIHTLTAMESTILLAMAFDRYVAICHPLRYNSVLTNNRIATFGVLAVIRGSLLTIPCIFLIKRLSYCSTNIISHTYCEHMAIVKIACSDTTINQIYGLTALSLIIAVDTVCVTLSYTVIARAVMKLSSNEARHKAISTCGSHICVILISYVPALFSFFSHRFGNNISPKIHITLANLYILIPPMCNPIIYGVKTKEIQDKICLILYIKQKYKMRTTQIASYVSSNHNMLLY
ncbi:olfactory receptor 52P1-like [Bombina bombina]|uniref:olfactory receptor 52P1-like n=1 Tax=Bombina bombina TaxID=8345 RepID=UPI00235B1C20|nr:olfactory receptor 52P1-like [Bombina bombina]